MQQIEFINQTHLPQTLVENVIEQFGGWEDFAGSAEDVANHGIDGGFSGFIYHRETVRFAAKNLNAILGYAKDMADELGEDGAYSLIANFNCLPDYSADGVAEAIHTHELSDDPWNDDYVQVMNALAWFAAEEVSRSFVDVQEAA